MLEGFGGKQKCEKLECVVLDVIFDEDIRGCSVASKIRQNLTC